MTLTVCVGASGSGKTTFLNDVHKSHKCTYIRQYHNLRPYIKVSSIPAFDPTQLPYWDIYINEKKDKSILVGGTIAGQFMAGLSGGQRKLLLFELIFQRTALQDNLLIVLDEPFAGVTDDFVPFIVKRLNEMRQKHNILLVTNDHVETLKTMADNTVIVSAIDRTKVKINEKEGVDRDTALLAMSIGDQYVHRNDNNDLKFFLDVELSKNGGIPGVAGFAVFSFGLFLMTFWNSNGGSEPLVLIAAGIVSFFTANPYFLQLTDWRIYMKEEAEALLHSSKTMNKILKLSLTMTLLVIICSCQYGVINACLTVDTLAGAKFYFGIMFDSLSLLVTIALLGLFTNMSFEAVQIFGGMPFLLMIFFSTTFSPGAGVNGLKNLRYLFARYYLWCMVPGYDMLMEGCPEKNTLLYLILSSLIVPVLFVCYKGVKAVYSKLKGAKAMTSRRESMKTYEFAELQLELFGEKALRNLKHIGSVADLQKLAGSLHSTRKLSNAPSSDGTDKNSEVVVLDDEERSSQYSV